jgi:putative transposase
MLAQLMDYPLSVVCRVLGVTQSGFHAWRSRAPSRRSRERDDLRTRIRAAFDAHRGRYGAPRVYRVLCEQHVGNQPAILPTSGEYARPSAVDCRRRVASTAAG